MKHVIKKNNNFNVNLKFEPSTMTYTILKILYSYHAICFTWIGSTYYTRL